MKITAASGIGKIFSPAGDTTGLDTTGSILCINIFVREARLSADISKLLRHASFQTGRICGPDMLEGHENTFGTALASGLNLVVCDS